MKDAGRLGVHVPVQEAQPDDVALVLHTRYVLALRSLSLCVQILTLSLVERPPGPKL